MQNQRSAEQSSPAADGPQRVAKIMAQRGICSRRVAERLIAAGFVTVDGECQREQGWKAAVTAVIEIDPRGQAWLDQALTLVVNKPVGVVSTQPEGAQVPAWKLLIRSASEGDVPAEVMERICAQPWYFSVTGRLDKESRGLLIMTQDGVLAKNITGSHRFVKHYEVVCSEPVKQQQIEQLRNIRRMDDRVLKPMQVSRMNNTTLKFQLVEGRKHQIRRACQQVGLHVTDLLRTQVGPVKIGKLGTGHWRLATDGELAELSGAGKAAGSPSKGGRDNRGPRQDRGDRPQSNRRGGPRRR